MKALNNQLDLLVRKLVLENALRYGGKAKADPVMGKLLSARPDLKTSTKELKKTVGRIVTEINAIPLSKQKELAAENWPELLVHEKPKPKKKVLPPLPNVEKYSLIHTRFCPNPDGALHVGGARAAVLSDEYAKEYGGRFTLRFDDTDPRTKSPILEAYDWIREDLRWLGVKWDSEVYQSDRMPVYYAYAEKLFSMGAAYVCNCDPENFRKLIVEKAGCPCRGLPPEEHLSRWHRMLDGTYREGEVVARIKTDLDHPNPAVRDWPALRIIDTKDHPHPRMGDKYRVWPLFAYCSGIDDHDLQISHILRGKEHLTNTTRQLYLYSHFGWEYPEAIHYGRLKIIGSTLSKSKIRDGIEKGVFSGWDDPELGTLMALRRRGIAPETIRQIMVEVGPRPVDATLSWENIYAINRKRLDPVANRYFVVIDPVKMTVRSLGKKSYISKLPLNPSRKDAGYRTLKVTASDDIATLYISKNDLDLLRSNRIVRLMGLFNIEVNNVGSNEVEARFHSEAYMEARKLAASLIHWLPQEGVVKVRVVMPSASVLEGYGEANIMAENVGSVVQMERFGFGRIDSKLIDQATLYYAHR